MHLAEKKRLFVWMGRVVFVVVAASGFAAFLVFDASTVVRVINLASAVAGAAVVRMKPSPKVGPKKNHTFARFFLANEYFGV